MAHRAQHPLRMALRALLCPVVPRASLPAALAIKTQDLQRQVAQRVQLEVAGRSKRVRQVIVLRPPRLVTKYSPLRERMPCMPRSPFQSPIVSLMLAGDAFSQLTPADDVATAFEEFKTKAWDVIESANDPAPYTTSWNLINLYGQSTLVEFSQSALDKLKEQLKSSIELMP